VSLCILTAHLTYLCLYYECLFANQNNTKQHVLITYETLNSYAFGHMLYQMVYGIPLNSSSFEALPGASSPDVGKMIDWIFIATFNNNLHQTVYIKRGFSDKI